MSDPLELLSAASNAVMETIQTGIYPPGRRTQLHVAYCYLAIDHQHGVAQLIDAEIYASAFALARPAFEAVVKGLWLFYCASDHDLEQHAAGRELEAIAPLLKAIALSPVDPIVGKCLANIKERYWKALSSLTHVGHAQLQNWLNPMGVQSAYSETAIQELANFACFMGICAGRELALRAGNQAGAERLRNMLPEKPPQ